MLMQPNAPVKDKQMKTEQFIIAIGASAGGMNQINTFFDYTPIDSVSYIIILHFQHRWQSTFHLHFLSLSFPPYRQTLCLIK